MTAFEATLLERVLQSRGDDQAVPGGDVGNARRFYAGVSAAALPLVPASLLLAWPDAAGTAPACGLATAWLLLHLTNLYILLRHGARVGWRYLLSTQYAELGLLAAAQALSSGWATPYPQLMMVHVISVALAFVPRTSVVFMLVALGAVVSPVAYGETHGRAGEVAVMLVLWFALSGFGLALMQRIRRQRVALADEARVDPLTGLENRRAFDERTPERLAAARAAGRPVVLGIGDVDRFKSINDRYGHPAGDACLRQVAAALRAACRQGDRVSRWGGDEFAVLLEGATPTEVARACRRLQEHVAAAVRDPEGRPVRLTLGWAFDDGRRSPDDLIAAADASLLARKAPRREAA